MALTEEQLKELALRVDAHLCSEGHVATSAAYAIAFAANLVASLPKPEPVGRGWLDPISGKLVCAAPDGSTLLYTEAPIAQPASAPSEQKPRFECWSTNEGDSWYEHPADAELLYDVLGNSPKVGDEFEVMAGWCSVHARYRIVSQKDDDFEVECISHPEDNAAPQSDYKAQRDTERLDYLQVNGATVSLVHLKKPSDFEFCVGGLYKSINRDLRTAIDTAIASVKGGA